MESSVNPEAAQAALASIDKSRADIADQLVSPWWYHPALGVLTGGMTMVACSGITWFVAAVVPLVPIIVGSILAVYVVGMILLSRFYYRRVGVLSDAHAAGLRKRRNLAVWMSVGLFLVGNYWAVTEIYNNPWPRAIAVGVVVAAFTVVWGRRFDKAMQAALRESA
ncbi:hypothetical protein [Glycomyces sp. NPDC021274]|jgi:hypothetical protein|uniref:hypothetical protein n=1 Tax=Glycomyces sp. NPDC021274 TaxID=3155120 RepID=UPI00340C69F6